MGYIDSEDEDLVTRINDKKEQKTSKQSCMLENNKIWEIPIQDNEINTKMESFKFIDVESKSQIGDEISQERHMYSKTEMKKIKERIRKEELQRVFSHALVSSFQDYIMEKASLQNEMRPFCNDEFEPIDKVFPKLKSSENFIWSKEPTDHDVIQSTDICINIGGK